MKPTGDQVLLKKQQGQEKTKSGIILTANDDNYQYADVIACGPGLFTQTGDRIPMTVSPGDVALLHGRLLRGDNEVILDNETYLLVRESDISMISTGNGNDK